MRAWNAAQVAAAAGATLARGADGEPARAVIDSRAVGPGDLFVGLPASASTAAGSRRARWTPARGASLVDAASAADARRRRRAGRRGPAGGAAAAWHAPGGARSARAVIGVTGSVGKTSTKELIAALIAPARGAWPPSRPTSTPRSGCRWRSSRADPAPRCSCSRRDARLRRRSPSWRAICEPDVGVITNIGPVHLEQVGSLEGVARAKAELLPACRRRGRAGRRAAARAVSARRT